MNRRPFLAALLIASSCSGSASGPIEPAPPDEGSSPILEASLQFGDPPVRGTIYLSPSANSTGSTYSVDLDEDGSPDHSGVLHRRIGFDYMFSEPGLHHIEVETGNARGTVIEEVPVVVNRPDVVQTVTETRIQSGDPHRRHFEGVAIHPDGTHVYVGDFHSRMIHAIDVASLEEIHRITMPDGMEGLSVSPSGRFLFVAFPWGGSARVAIPELSASVVRDDEETSASFAHALDDRRVIYGGRGDLVVFDIERGNILSRVRRRSPSGHMADIAVDASRRRVAVIERVLETDESHIHVLGLPDLTAQVIFRFNGGGIPLRLVFDPSGDRLFVLAREFLGVPLRTITRLVTIDARSGAIANRLTLEPLLCTLPHCLSHPAERSRDGRYLAFKSSGGALIIDTTTGLPIATVDPTGSLGTSIAASPIEDRTFWLLDLDGRLRKIVVSPSVSDR